jgi:hypothetical protein
MTTIPTFDLDKFHWWPGSRVLVSSNNTLFNGGEGVMPASMYIKGQHHTFEFKFVGDPSREHKYGQRYVIADAPAQYIDIEVWYYPKKWEVPKDHKEVGLR